jgi:hypothetical protein
MMGITRWEFCSKPKRVTKSIGKAVERMRKLCSVLYAICADQRTHLRRRLVSKEDSRLPSKGIRRGGGEVITGSVVFGDLSLLLS